MNAHANKGFAARAGFGLGTFVRFCLHDRRPALRWVKRVSLFLLATLVEMCIRDRYKLADVERRLGNNDKAKGILQQVISQYPGTSAAQLAQRDLKNLR